MVFSRYSKGFFKGSLPLGYRSIKPLQSNYFCDAIECTNSQVNGRVMLCGYAYHG